MKNIDLIAESWKDYELIDSGEDRKLERFGQYTLVRPETQALWQRHEPEEWSKAHAEFRFAEGKGVWKKKNVPENWEMNWEDVRFTARLTSFKHVGVFPEQAPNWEWTAAKVQALKSSFDKAQDKPKVLNLFGYTGIASIVAAKHGAEVTHVDASKQANVWAKANADLSGIEESSIRYILDDAIKFAERALRRGDVYEGIILDPPAFGRGAKGEVWKIEESLPRLLQTLGKLLSPQKGSFFVLNGYAAGYSPQAFAQAVEGIFPDTTGEFGELHIKEGEGDRVVPSGIYARFVR